MKMARLDAPPEERTTPSGGGNPSRAPVSALPELLRIQQHCPPGEGIDVEAVLASELEDKGILKRVRPGSKVVLAAGSRGIPNYQIVIRKLVALLQAAGAEVVIFPAMGSHGGGTGPGQVQILQLLGITEETVGAPVVDTMHVEAIGTTSSGITIYADRTLMDCDAIILVNRIKEHTEFSGSIQSGLLKMMAIGLGRAQGAAEVHRHAVSLGYEKAILEAARFYLERLPLAAGVALLDSPMGATAHLEVIRPADLESAERRLVQKAAGLSLKLPLDRIDVLVVDRMGKEISGTGMDTKVIGRIMNVYEPEPEGPRITRIFVRDLTPATHGNAVGIGLADFTTRRLIEKVDLGATNLNCLTAITPEKARLPMAFDHDRQALEAAIATTGCRDAHSVRLLWIRDTLSLTRLVASPAAVQSMDPAAVSVLGDPFPFDFDGQGDLTSPWDGFPG